MSFPLTTAHPSGACCVCLLHPATTERARNVNGSKAAPRRIPLERSIGCPTNRRSTKGKFKVGSSGGFFHAAIADARRTHPNTPLDARYNRTRGFQILFPARPPRACPGAVGG